MHRGVPSLVQRGCPVLLYGGVPSTVIWRGAQYCYLEGCPVLLSRGVPSTVI